MPAWEQIRLIPLLVIASVWLLFLVVVIFIPLPRLNIPTSIRSRRFVRSIWSVRAVLAALLILFVIAYAWLSISRHARFNSTGYDLAIHEQILWNTLNGRFFATSIEVDNSFADHFRPLLLFLVPIYGLWQRPETLLIIQVLVLASAAIPIYLLAKLKTGDRFVAAAIASVYLLYPAVGFIARFDFHTEVFAIPAFVAAFYMMETGRWGWASLWLIIPLLTKENMGLIVAMYGLYALLRWKRVMWGISWLVVGLVAFTATTFWLLPTVRGEPLDALARYQWMGDTPGEILLTLFTKPGLVWEHVVSTSNLTYLLQLLLPVGFLALLGVPELLLAIPIIGTNLLADHFCQSTIYCQYSAPIVPFVFIAAIFGLVRLSKVLDSRVKMRMVALLLIPVAIAALRIDNPFREQQLLPSALQVIDNAQVVEQALDSVPDNTSVVTTNDYAAHLSRREELYIIGIPSQRKAPVDPDVVFINLYDQQYILCDQYRDYLSQLDSKSYGVTFRTGGLIVIQRGAGSFDQFQDFLQNWNNCAG